MAVPRALFLTLAALESIDGCETTVIRVWIGLVMGWKKRKESAQRNVFFDLGVERGEYSCNIYNTQ